MRSLEALAEVPRGLGLLEVVAGWRSRPFGRSRPSQWRGAAVIWARSCLMASAANILTAAMRGKESTSSLRKSGLNPRHLPRTQTEDEAPVP